MTKAANSSKSLTRVARVALLCVCAILLAWAAPAIAAVTDDSLGLLKMSQNHPVSDRAAEQPETTDITDDPVLLSSSDRPGPQPFTFSLHTASLIKQTWAPAPPVRPPAIHAQN